MGGTVSLPDNRDLMMNRSRGAGFFDKEKKMFHHFRDSGTKPRFCRGKIGVSSPRFRWLAAVVMIASVLLFPQEVRSAGSPPADAKTAIVEKAPDFILKDLNGRRFRLSDFRGKQPVLIIFSTTWCTFCRDEIPHFKAIHAAYVKQGLEIVNIDIQESKDKVAKFTAKYALPYRVLLDEDAAVSSIYDIRGVPSMVLVDQNGNIVCRQCQRVEPLIETLLKKK
jgi:peroxiredoxin